MPNQMNDQLIDPVYLPFSVEQLRSHFAPTSGRSANEGEGALRRILPGIFDMMRNQIARNIDVMLERNDDVPSPPDQRRPERTLLALLTPGIFRQHPL
jgi:hypothetical protein